MATAPVSPPPGFVLARSRVEGLVIFAPAPRDAGPRSPMVPSCPTCGAPSSFDPVSQTIRCARCGNSSLAAVAVGELHRAEGEAFTVEALRQAERGWGAPRRVLGCSQCGAELVVDPSALTTTCPLCASNKVALADGDPNTVRPGYLLPFQLKSDGLATPVKRWLRGGWMHPSTLSSLAKVDAFVGIYTPYWVFDADAHARYRCEVGTEHTSTSKDANGHRRTETTVTWAWKEGQIDTSFSGVVVPGTNALSRRLVTRLHPSFDLGGLVPYRPELLAGFQAQAFDISLPDAWESGRAEIRDRVRRQCIGHANGDRVRNMSLNCSLDHERWRYVLLPFYVGAYRFNGQPYQVMVNGQTGDIDGQKPVLWLRVYTVMALVFVPAVCTGLLGLPLLVVAGVGIVLLVFAFVFGVLGLVGAISLYRTAAEREAA